MRRILASLLPVLLFLLTIGIAFFVALREDNLFAMPDRIADSVDATLAANATEPVNIAATLVAEAAPQTPIADDDMAETEATEIPTETATPAAEEDAMADNSDSDMEDMSAEDTADDSETVADAADTAMDETDAEMTEADSAEPTEKPSDGDEPDAAATADDADDVEMTPTMAGPTAEPCRPRSDWHPYMVEIGENLFRIGLRYNLTVAQMQRANCLPTTRIDAGQIIFVPEKDLPPTPTAMPLAPADNDLPLLGFGAASYSVSESAGTLSIFLQTSAPVSEAVRFEIGAVEGTAVNGADFSMTAKTVTIAAGQSDLSLSIPITDDEMYEGDEVFFLYVTDAVNAIVPESEASITVTITENDAAPEQVDPTATPASETAETPTDVPAPAPTLGPDGMPTIGFAASAYEVNESDGSILIPLTLSNPTDTDVLSLVTISNISTVYGDDMSFEIGNYIIPLGQTTIYVQVLIVDDDIAEETEQFTIYLFEPSNAHLSPTTGSAVVSIVDNDG